MVVPAEMLPAGFLIDTGSASSSTFRHRAPRATRVLLGQAGRSALGVLMMLE